MKKLAVVMMFAFSIFLLGTRAEGKEPSEEQGKNTLPSVQGESHHAGMTTAPGQRVPVARTKDEHNGIRVSQQPLQNQHISSATIQHDTDFHRDHRDRDSDNDRDRDHHRNHPTIIYATYPYYYPPYYPEYYEERTEGYATVTLSLDDIIELVTQGVSEDDIIYQIMETRSVFYLSSEEITYLRIHHVPIRVINYMIDTGRANQY